MTGQKNNIRIGRSQAAAAAAFLGGWASLSAASTAVVPRVDVSGTWTDNLGLATTGQQSGEIWQLAPGLNFSHDSPLEHATLDYEAREIYFTGGPNGDEHNLVHSGTLFSDSKLIPQWFELDLAALRTQSASNPTQPASSNSNYLFPVQNVANRTTGSVEPILRHAFRLFKIDAEYTRSFTHNQQLVGQPQSGVSLANSDNGNARATISSVDAQAPLTWDAKYQRTQTDYNIPGYPRFLSESAGADLGVRLTTDIRLVADGGKESNPLEGVSAGGLGATYWAAGLDWSPDRYSDLKVVAGHRFFGKSFEAHCWRQSRLLNLQVNYTEMPTTEDAQLTSQSLIPQQTLQPINIPGQPGFVRPTPDVFLQKALDARLAITGHLTSIGVAVQSQKRSYITVNGVQVSQSGAVGVDDSQRGVSVFATRRIGPLTEAQITASLNKVDLREGGAYGYTDKRLTARLSHRLGAWTSLILLAEHDQWSGGISAYKVNIVTLDFNMTFGQVPGQSPMGTGSLGGGGPTP
jgi:uncharacterized protein (PEP-CTERM system associated)